MRLWFVFELLLFFVLLAFAAARSVVGKQEAVITTEGPVIDEALSVVTTVPAVAESAVTEAAASVVTEEIPTTPATGPSRFCNCVSLECSCCREFRLPVLPIASSGCASLQYLRGDRLALTMRVGDAVLRNVTISGRRPRPACINLPGGFSRFCGRVYGIQRQGDDFKACLGLELRALAGLEASMRVSCFRFSPKGVTMEAAPPLPALPSDEDDEDEDDDDGLFGFGGDDDEDDEDDDDELPFADEEDDDETENAVAEPDVDYTGFSALGDILGGIFEDEPESPPKKKKKPAAEKKPVIATQAPTVNKVEVVTTPRAKPETTEKPMLMETATEMAQEDKVVISTTEKQPTTTIVLSPTSSVKITTNVASTTPKAVVPDPEENASEEKQEEEEDEEEEQEDDEEQDEEEPEEDEGDEDEELNAEFDDDDDDETTESAVDSFSNEIAEAIKGVEEELSSVADIDLETDSDEKPAATDAATAAVSDSVTDEPEPQGGVPLNGRDKTAALGPSNGTTVELRAQRGPCDCEDGVCSCCTGYIMDFFSQKGCVNLAYDPDDFAISVRVLMNDRTVYKNSVSGKNPQPVCVPMPRFTSLKMCVRFSNVFLVGRNVHACVDVDGMFRDSSLFRMSMDCMRLGANGVALLKPEDGGGLPPDEGDYAVPDEGPDYDIEGEGSVEDNANATAVKVSRKKLKPTPATVFVNKPYMLFLLVLSLAVHGGRAVPTFNDPETTEQPTTANDEVTTETAPPEEFRDSGNETLPWWRRRPYPLRQSLPRQCQCEDFQCGCCAGIEMMRLNISRRGCLNFRYDPDEFSIEMEMLMNDRTLFSRSISAKNPPPMCIPLPSPVSFIPRLDFCARLFNVFTPGRNLHMCLDWSTRVNQSPVLIMEFDCMRIGADGFAFLKPEAGGGLPAGGGDLEVEAPIGGGGGGSGGVGGILVNQTNEIAVLTPVGDPGPMTRCGTCECRSHTECGCCTQFIVQRAAHEKNIEWRNPPPLCVPIPQLPLVAICIRLYDIQIIDGHLSVCLNLELQIQGFTVFVFQFDCIRFLTSGITLFKPAVTPAHTSLLHYKSTASMSQ
ncbi:hypothetical protein B566_EDAN011401 [Ephemera danica]|nr:hypothetical protein B566_EDAN011401 [Ephemera danica]